MTDLTTLNLDEFGEAAPFLQPAAEAVARAETTIATEVWLAGQALHYLHAKCQHGQWAKACEAIDIDVDRALRYRHVFERWPKRESLPDLRRELLITLAAPSVPESARQRVVEMAANGDAPSVREAASIVDEERTKASAPTEFDHDIDRTTQEPENGSIDGDKELRKAIAAIQRSIDKACKLCKQLNQDRAWLLLEQELQNMAESVRNQ